METLGLLIAIGFTALSIPFWIMAIAVAVYVEKYLREGR
jgi:predicted metal-binding membrane protein